jgi:hypothetical protein
MMDGIFGHNNFRNEIVWKRTGSHGGSKRWGPVHDTILFYTASDAYTWNRTFQDYDTNYIKDFYKLKDDRGFYQLVSLTGAGTRTGDSGKPWRDVNPTDIGRHWAVPTRALQNAYPDRDDLSTLTTQEKLELLDKAGLVGWPERGKVPRQKRYSDENPGTPIQDIITDIGPLSANAEERMGYPTQKPIKLLDRIIRASSNKGDVIFDPFCGCGTTIYAAHEAERQWIGCDIAILSIKLVREKLIEKYRLVEGKNYTVDGIPTSVDGALELFTKDPSTFQNWFVERVGGFPMQRKSADRGIDGRIYFETRDGLREMMIQVKGGKHVRPTDVRDLRGVLEREPTAEMAGFLSITPPTKAMKDEASEAGTYEYAGVHYPRIQFLTTEDVLVGKREFQMPTRVNTKLTTGQQSFYL